MANDFALKDAKSLQVYFCVKCETKKKKKKKKTLSKRCRKQCMVITVPYFPKYSDILSHFILTILVLKFAPVHMF